MAGLYDNLAKLYDTTNRKDEADKAREEVAAIRKRLAEPPPK